MSGTLGRNLALLPSSLPIATATTAAVVDPRAGRTGAPLSPLSLPPLGGVRIDVGRNDRGGDGGGNGETAGGRRSGRPKWGEEGTRSLGVLTKLRSAPSCDPPFSRSDKGAILLLCGKAPKSSVCDLLLRLQARLRVSLLHRGRGLHRLHHTRQRSGF